MAPKELTKTWLLALSVVLLFFSSHALAREDLPHLIRKTRPAVVTIQTFAGGKLLRQGTGFFITESGHIITNRHVIEGGYHLKITTSVGKEYNVNKIVAVDSAADLARIVLEAKERFVPLRLSSRIPQVGERILVVGSPMGLEQTASEGIISAVREIPGMGLAYQLTAPISPGSSGSPVLTMDGSVIGVATLHVKQGENLNFAIPASRVLALQAMEKRLLAEWTTGLPVEKLKEASLLYFEGMKHLLRGDYREALGYLNRSIRINPEEGRTWKAVGYCSLKLKEYESAISAYKKAITLGEGGSDTYKNLGRAYYHVQDYELAVVSYAKAVELDPSDAHGHMLLGIAYRRVGDSKKAIMALRQSISLEPGKHEFYPVLAGIYFQQEQDELAIRYLSKAIALDPNNVTYRSMLIQFLLSRPDGSAAYREYKELVRISPEAAKEFEGRLRSLGYVD